MAVLKSIQDIMRGDVAYSLLHLWSERLSEAEAAAIRDRVLRDPGHRENLDGSLEVIARMEGLKDDGAIREIALDYRRLLQARRSRRSVALGIAAGILVAFGGALVYSSFWGGKDDSSLQKYFTRVGEQRTVELDDGSVVTLNTGGQLVVDYSEQTRRVLLERGEAFFEAMEEPRPFTVELGALSVSALGTAFNIRKHPEYYQVAVIEGAVAIGASADEASAALPLAPEGGRQLVLSVSAPHRIEAGWVAEFDVWSNQLRAFRPESIQRYQEWRRGMLSFYGEPLYQVVQEMNRYSRKKILIEDTAVMDLIVYTAIRVDQINIALSGLEQLLPIRVTRHYDRIVITGSAPNGDEHDTQEDRL